ncbi:sulfatase-like hydrolase/transferase [Puniceicoccales bacterium CK1056]|uniref:Sulfatase-like hydrolase/transferase n=1 Tax=Oceanipulchritudo coccoides TaxID=2706888 RepID=A0A6B2M300_9BACT|nr:sulfatase-like hydrolase/transferase [Oceanipulchritudo coccoides]NDV62080.1 sulfatase-like hydrolase/transferase [Oceanipulchritudo coccoides]
MKYSSLAKTLAAFLAFDVVALAAEQPNIVFIFTDDQGWGDVAAYGHPDVRTPNLDRLAKQGTLFTQFYVGSPVCSPSRASLLTGRFCAEIGIDYAIGGPAGQKYNHALWLDPELPNVYKTFAANGYRVGHYGKWHLGAMDKDGNMVAPAPVEYGAQESATAHSTGPKLKGLNNSNKSEIIANYGIDFIERNQSSPFFLNLWIMDPHSVLDPTQEQMDPYMDHTHPAVRSHLRSSQTVYYAIIENIDRAVGRVIQKLEECGLLENTIILFSSDNGPSPLWSSATGHAGSGLTGPFRGTKASLYEGGIRVPFIVSWPGHIPAGKVQDQSVVAAVDMYPSLVQMAGLEVELPEELDGEDRTSVLLGTPSKRSKPLMWEYRFGNWGREIQVSPTLAMLDGDWKLLMNPDRSRVELYNIREDITETENRARYETEIVGEMSARLMDWWDTQVPNPKNAPPWSGHSGWRMPRGN